MPAKVYLTRRNNGFYYVGYIEDGRKVWRSTKARRRTDAIAAARELETLLKKRLTAKPFSQFTEEFLTYARGTFRPKTVEIYERAFKNFTALHGDLPLASLTLKHIDEYKAHRAGEVSPVSLNVELRALKSALNVAVGWSLLGLNPFQRVRQMTVPEATPAFLSQGDFQKLIQTIKYGWLRDIVTVAACTGLRRGELLNLKWNDVDLPRRLLHVRSSPTFRAKGGKRRTVPLNDVAYSIFNRKNVSSCSKEWIADYIFKVSGRPVTGDYLTHRFKEAVNDAGLGGKVHFHSLRHTFASWLVQSGASLFVAQRLLGHSTPQMTQVYAHDLPPSVVPMSE